MDIEQARAYALRFEAVTEDLFAESWISYRVAGKWFMLIQLDAPAPRVAVKLPPDEGEALRDTWNGVQAAYHMNKKHWNDLYLDMLDDELVYTLIRRSYRLVVNSLPKSKREAINNHAG